MKKLLVLALVLSMATMASAALTVSISGPTQVLPLSVNTYTIGYSGDVLGGFDIDIITDVGAQPFGIGGGVITAVNRDTGADSVGINSATGNYEITAESFTMATPVDMGSPLATFTFAAPASGEVKISLIENAFLSIAAEQMFGAQLNGITVLVPEPMTMTLLGLGGLFLRRRSK